MKQALLLASVFLLLAGTATAQKKNIAPLTADSLATGNYKDVLSSFFQLALNKFTGPDKELRFTSSPFAVMAKMNPDLLRDDQYYKYRKLRDLNFSFAAKLDTAYKFNGFSSGIKYALINRRDETVSRAFLIQVAGNHTVAELKKLNFSLEGYIASLVDSPALQAKIRDQKTAFFNGAINFGQLDKDFKKEMLRIAERDTISHVLALIKEDPAYNIKKDAQQIYNNLKKAFNNKLLWTVGVSDTTYKNQFMFSNLVITSELVKGIVDSSKRGNIELNIKTSLQYVDDTLKTGRDLKRSVFNIEPGFNFILNAKDTDRSFLEFKLSGGYTHTFSTLYQDEERDKVTLNGTLRVRILNDIWIPLEIKYDPKNGNFLGLLNVRVNFTAMGK